VKALSVSIFSNTVVPPVDALTAELAHRYELPVDSQEFHRLGQGDYMLVLSDKTASLHVYNGIRPLQIPPLCRRWSRFKEASGIAMSDLVEVELDGISAHA
jgi:hypothetical protein